MTSRSFRLETRSRAKDEMKRIIQTVEKVRKWERRWVDLGLSNSLRVYKWVPIRDDKADDEMDDKENEPIELTEGQNPATQDRGDDSTLPEITQVTQPPVITHVPLETPQLLTDHEVLLMSDDADKVSPSDSNVPSSISGEITSKESAGQQPLAEATIDEISKSELQEKSLGTVEIPIGTSVNSNPSTIDGGISEQVPVSAVLSADAEKDNKDLLIKDLTQSSN